MQLWDVGCILELGTPLPELLTWPFGQDLVVGCYDLDKCPEDYIKGFISSLWCFGKWWDL